MATIARSHFDPQRQVSVAIVHWQNNEHTPRTDELVTEEPLEIRLCGRDERGTERAETVAVIMRTPGHDDELATGFLLTEGLIASGSELADLRAGLDDDGMPSGNIVEIRPAPGVDLAQRVKEQGYTRKFAVNASCGICGKNTVAAACSVFSRLPESGFSVTPDALYTLPDRLREEQRVFSYTGGLHAAGLFDHTGTLLALREDIGRHNAVDKLIGRAVLDAALPLNRAMLLVSGRLSFEIVLKAFAARIPLIAAVSAPSSLALDLAEAAGITIVAFLRGSTMNVYTHPARIQPINA